MHTVAGADKLVLLKEGKVAECGTPAELEARGGEYVRMKRLQAASMDWKLN